MVRALLIFAALILAISCSPPTTKPETLSPSTQETPTAAETAKRIPVTADEIKNVVDLPEYPGATVVSNNRLSSPSFAPDEARFELERKSADAPDKITKFYEEQLNAKVNAQKEVWGSTKKGHFVKVHIDPDGSGSSYKLTVISYIK